MTMSAPGLSPAVSAALDSIEPEKAAGRRARVTALAAACLAAACSGGGSGSSAATVVTSHPILFVTQVPMPNDVATVTSAFANHLGDPRSAARGGDLWIRYGDGTLKNLTEAGGYGESGLQGASSIAVREPCVHFSGTRALFSMVVGAPGQGQKASFYWQLYEIDGVGPGDVPRITKVPFQPADANNVAPAYASDGRILFVSDRPRDGQPHLRPQLDEYGMVATTTGLWSLDPASGELHILNHTPSGAFRPIVDSFGRVVSTRWDHLLRDQQADFERMGKFPWGTFNYSGEDPSSVPTASNAEHFPEPRQDWIEWVKANPDYGGDPAGYEPHLVGLQFNHFFPWQMNQDGTEEETLVHIGRHELLTKFQPSFNDDPNLFEFELAKSAAANTASVQNFFHVREDPTAPGTFMAVDAPELRAHASGRLIRFRAAPGDDPDEVALEYVTHPDTVEPHPSPQHSGRYRNPLPLSDGIWIASHTSYPGWDANVGTPAQPKPLHRFRLATLVKVGAWYRAGAKLTGGIHESVQYFDPDLLVSYSGELWELDPVEVVARAAPALAFPTLPYPELQVFQDELVSVGQLKDWLESKDLALIVARDVTTRDANDSQQPFNLRIPGGSASSIPAPGKVYDVTHLQLFQADLVRGMTLGGTSPIPGRRPLAQPLHDDGGLNPPAPLGPPGSVTLGPDGSMAALVPARRALSWQLVDPSGKPVVRERYWLSFQPGEIRSCTSCHGLNGADHLGQPPPANKPAALGLLLQHLKATGQL
jgi:hypothetical protein